MNSPTGQLSLLSPPDFFEPPFNRCALWYRGLLWQRTKGMHQKGILKWCRWCNRYRSPLKNERCTVTIAPLKNESSSKNCANWNKFFFRQSFHLLSWKVSLQAEGQVGCVGWEGCAATNCASVETISLFNRASGSDGQTETRTEEQLFQESTGEHDWRLKHCLNCKLRRPTYQNWIVNYDLPLAHRWRTSKDALKKEHAAARYRQSCSCSRSVYTVRGRGGSSVLVSDSVYPSLKNKIFFKSNFAKKNARCRAYLFFTRALANTTEGLAFVLSWKTTQEKLHESARYRAFLWRINWNKNRRTTFPRECWPTRLKV